MAQDSTNFNNWTNASFQKLLNNETNGYITPNYNTNNIRGITAITKDMIEKVKWNLGGMDMSIITTQQFYE